jgi:hypothetical protein
VTNFQRPFYSFSSLEREFGKVDGRPTGMGEYAGRIGSFPGTSLGVEGVSTSGELSFGSFRGKIAHASPLKVIHQLYQNFGTLSRLAIPASELDVGVSPWIRDPVKGIISSITFNPLPRTFGFHLGKFYWEYGGVGNNDLFCRYFSRVGDGGLSDTDENISASFGVGLTATIEPSNFDKDLTDYIVDSHQKFDYIRSKRKVIDEDIIACRNNTVVYLVTGKGKGYGSGEEATSTGMISTFKLNGKSVVPSDMSVLLTGGSVHSGSNQGHKWNSNNVAQRTCMAVHSVPSTLTIRDIKTASFRLTRHKWNGNTNGSDKDHLHHGIILLIPNRWERISSTMYGSGKGTMTLGPYDIAIVTSAATGWGSDIVSYKRYWRERPKKSQFANLNHIMLRNPIIIEQIVRETFRNMLPKGHRIISPDTIRSQYSEFINGNTLTTPYVDEQRKRLPADGIRSVVFDGPDATHSLVECAETEQMSPRNLRFAPITQSSVPLQHKFLPAAATETIACFGVNCIAIFGNPHNATITCNISNPGFSPYVTIFRFVGDGYMTSRAV